MESSVSPGLEMLLMVVCSSAVQTTEMRWPYVGLLTRACKHHIILVLATTLPANQTPKKINEKVNHR